MLKSLAADEGLHQLVPYFTLFLADEARKLDACISFHANAHQSLQVPHSLSDLGQLRALMNMAQCLLVSPHLHVEPYVCQLSVAFG